MKNPPSGEKRPFGVEVKRSTGCMPRQIGGETTQEKAALAIARRRSRLKSEISRKELS
jgi:hypothetical protein